jgi:hypothetical protein
MNAARLAAVGGCGTKLQRAAELLADAGEDVDLVRGSSVSIFSRTARRRRQSGPTCIMGP